MVDYFKCACGVGSQYGFDAGDGIWGSAFVDPDDGGYDVDGVPDGSQPSNAFQSPEKLWSWGELFDRLESPQCLRLWV